MTWTALLLTCAGCYLLKLAGLALPARVLDAPAVRRTAELLPVAMLASLIVVQAVTNGQELTADPRLAGLAVAAVAVLLRAPFLLVVALAAATAALLRASGA